MTSRSTHPWTDGSIRWLLPVVVFASGLGSGVDAVASSATAERGEEHAHYCKCSRCRGASCCCKPAHADAPAAASVPAAPARLDGAPCLNSDPCGDSGLPTSATAGPIGKAAALALDGRLIRAAGGLFVPCSSQCVLPPRRASRLDDPPERAALG